MKKFIAEVVPLESCYGCEVTQCTEDGGILWDVFVYRSNDGVLYAEGFSEHSYPFPVGIGKYFALKFTDITDGI